PLAASDARRRSAPRAARLAANRQSRAAIARQDSRQGGRATSDERLPQIGVRPRPGAVPQGDIMIAALLLLTAPDVRYAIHVEARSWQPLEPAAVEQLLDAQAMPVLARSGAMKLTKTGFADLKAGDYALLVEGRFIEEAEQFSVYLTFGPG